MKNSEKLTLTEREKYFCYHYINNGNLREAALLAGYDKDPEKKAIQLLSKELVKNEINKLYKDKKMNLSYKTCIGYERLAFGSISDAITLLYTDKLDKTSLENMDLFNIAEIKRPKDGALEIKFFDRIKALEKLEETNNSHKTDINPFYHAMEQSIEALNNKNIIVKKEN